MKKLVLSALLASSLSVVVPSAVAQPFVGFDDFSTLSGNPPSLDGKWAYFFRINGAGTNNGFLDFSGTRLDFSKGAGAGSYFLGWLGAPPSTARSVDSYTTSWTAEVSVSSTFATLASPNEFLTIGIEVAGGNTQFSSLMLNTFNGGNIIQTEGSGTTVNTIATSVVTDVRLRLAWDATTKLLVSSFSTDSGNNYTNITTFTPDSQWTGSTQATNGFFFEIWANTNAAASIAPGVASLDNFSIVAVPEPSTYALLAAGLGLVGFGFWRRRRNQTAAL